MSRRAIVLGMLITLAGFSITLPALAEGELPPLIDREVFFGDPEISGSQLSPDGKYISFIKPLNGTRNIWVKKTDEPFDKARPLTDQTERPIMGYFWSRDGEFILYVKDKGGDENFNIYKVDPNAKPAEGETVPASQNLTDLEGVRAQIYSVPKTDPDLMFIGLNDRDKAWHDLYSLKISTGELTKIRENTERIAGWVFDLKGQLRLAARTTNDGSTEILRVDEEGFTPVYSCSVFESCGPVRFHKDGKRVYMVTNKGDDVDLISLTLFDPKSGKEELVESDPEGRVDFGGPVFSDKTDELIATTYSDERTRIYFRDKDYEKDFRYLEKQLKGYEVSAGSSTRDERLWLVTAYGDTEPGKRYLFDRKSRKLTEQYTAREDLPREALSPMKAISYKSSDGLEIPAYLTLPKGVPAKKLPLVVFPHGGPWARDSWGYDSFAQFLANRGFAVLQPNFRGSTGYGKAFLNAANGEWGQLMQDDLTWGVKHLVKKGIADKDKVAIMGGSYGGYATLAGVAFTPDVYAAAVSIVGPSNLLTLLDSIPPYWEAIRVVFHERMADPNTPEGKALLEKQSPLYSADKIKTPLLVVQGANDPRVKQAESDQIVVALREREFPVEYLVAPDEGHGFAKPVNNLAMIAALETFFNKHIGTRYQEGASDEVAGRLEEITVDVATVKLPEAVDTAAFSDPKPAAGLTPGTVRFKTIMNAMGNEIPMDTEQTVSVEGETFVVVQKTTTPQGEVMDKTVLAKDSLQLVKRHIEQGPITVNMAAGEAKLEGKIAMMGNETPIAVDLEGPLFADGAGTGAVLATLPLEEGYKTLFRNFDVQTQKVKLMKLEVVGVESVTVPAGTFEAYKAEVKSAEGDPGSLTIWVDTKSPRFVRSVAIIPAAGNATATTELLP